MKEDPINRVWEAAILADLPRGHLHAIEEVLRLARVELRLRAETPARLDEVETAAAEVLGSGDKAWKWMRTFNRGLQDIPLDLLITEAGVEQIKRELGRLDHGVYS